jgi:alpha-glucosidase (family GH31 glycosyl hydrolase)
LSAGLSGFPFWMSDIGGWEGEPEKEVFCRWAQFAAFSPGMGTSHAPHDFDPETVEIFKRFVGIHEGLLPYIYSLARRATLTGEPLLRPLFYHHRDDPKSALVDDQFYLGDSLLVIPMLEPGTEREAYFPPGRFRPLFASEPTAEGPANVTHRVLLHECPVYLREGGIVPSRIDETLLGRDKNRFQKDLCWYVWPSEPGGEFDYFDGTNVHTFRCRLRTEDGEKRAEIDLPVLLRNQILRLRTGFQPRKLTLGDKPLSLLTEERLEEAGVEGYFYSREEGLIIRCRPKRPVRLLIDWRP